MVVLGDVMMMMIIIIILRMVLMMMMVMMVVVLMVAIMMIIIAISSKRSVKSNRNTLENAVIHPYFIYSQHLPFKNSSKLLIKYN